VTEPSFLDLLLLLASAVFVVAAFQRLHVPSSLGYLLVGVLLGPYTAGPVIDSPHIRAVAEFGIVFLLFTIGLNFSLPQIYALRHLVLGLGTAQVLATTAIVGAAAWLGGLPPAAAFVVGAVFAQSSTTIIGRQLAEQGEGESRHGRLALAMSVFQDVTAVPFVVVIPVLGAAAATALVGPLAWALAKAVAAFAVVWAVGRWVLPPLFHAIAERRSAELFTLAVLLVSLAAAWTTEALGLSMAFGAFLAGMMLGETEFRHQIESTIRPFRDVLLGLFFVSIGMLFDPAALPAVWHWALGGAAALLAVKAVLVAQLVRFARVDVRTAWRTGIVLAVGGEFGFALLAIALGAQVIEQDLAQAALAAVLFSMIAGPFLIRYNRVLAPRGGASGVRSVDDALRAGLGEGAHLRDHVIICGYGRIGQPEPGVVFEARSSAGTYRIDSGRDRFLRRCGVGGRARGAARGGDRRVAARAAARARPVVARCAP
jgi:monovalent cation:H+ antiporter-2, CPA2 family